MKFGPLDRFLTGVAVPVAALRSAESCGVGEFLDLPLLGGWCRACGLDLIQILPVNDTGTNSSPYSSLSAFALHPLYVRLPAVRGAAAFGGEIRRFREEAEEARRFSYPRVLAFKLETLVKIFDSTEGQIRGDKGWARWQEENPWVIRYAAFKALKTEAREAPWSTWGPALFPGGPGNLSEPGSPDRFTEIWRSRERACLFHAWVQYILEEQLTSAAQELARQGIRLKGDLPILMSEESADVWGERRFFDLSARAGAPPDMYSTDGQNWGFPVYDWKALAADGHTWWKSRLRQAAKFFHAYRIDHVLGFFRIWCIPRGERRGILGRFSPVVPLTRDSLSRAGFDPGRIRWLSAAHRSSSEIEAGLGELGTRARGLYLERVGREELYTLKTGLDAEERIAGLPEDPRLTGFLMAMHTDRTLLSAGDDFLPAWYFWEASSFKGLRGEEQARLRGLIAACRGESEAVWEDRGRKILGVLGDTTDMLVCAEDLGDVPDCVPRVLLERGILGLRVLRWARDYKTPGAPFIDPAAYPRLTVATTSVHDTSTLRGWWEENAGEREEYFRHLGEEGQCPPRMPPELLQKILKNVLGSGSLLCVLPLQDLLDLDSANWSAAPAEDRINVPGTVTEKNWTWRMPLSLESLEKRAEPAGSIRRLLRERSRRVVK